MISIRIPEPRKQSKVMDMTSNWEVSFFEEKEEIPDKEKEKIRRERGSTL